MHKKYRYYNQLAGLLLSLTLFLTACENTPSPTTILTTSSSTANNADWPQSGHDAQLTAFNPAFTAINPTNIANLELAWVYKSTDPLTVAPVIAGSKLFLDNGHGSVSALDRNSGQLLWSFKYTGHRTTTPLVQQSQVFFCTDTGVVYALNTDTGSQNWQQDLHQPVLASPSFNTNTGLLYIASLSDSNHQQPGGLIAFDPSTGSIRWKYELPLTTLSANNTSQAFQTIPPMDNAGAFYLPNRVSLLSSGIIRIAPNQNVSPESWNNLNPVGLLATTNQGPTLFSSLTHSGGAVAIPASKALSSPDWYFQGPADSQNNTYPHPGAFGNQTLVYTAANFDSQTHLMALGADGKLHWDNPLNTALAAPTIAAGLVFIGDESGHLLAFELATGKKAWQYDTKAAIRTSIIPAGDMLYAASTDGNLYAFSAKTNTPSASSEEVKPGQADSLAVYAGPDQNGNQQIFALKEGQPPVQLTQGDFAEVAPELKLNNPKPDLNRSPAISPDGRKIAFVSFSKGAATSSLFLMNSDGSNIQALPDSNANPNDLAWTPDGQTILFTSEKDGQLYSENLGGAFVGLHAITTNYYSVLHYPHASPDNQYIFWQETSRLVQNGVGSGRIVRLDRNGQNKMDLITGLFGLSGLAVAPLSGQVVFAALDRTTKQSWLWLTDSQGRQPQQLVEGYGPLDFAPDGRVLYQAKVDSKEQMALRLDLAGNSYPQSTPLKIADQRLSWVKPDSHVKTGEASAFQPYYFPASALQNLLYGKFVFSTKDGAIYESDSYGVRTTKLTAGNPAHDSQPNFSRDGSQIVFVRQSPGAKPQIWVMDALGQNLRQLTTNGANTEPSWSGDGKSIAFVSQREGETSQIWIMQIAAGESSASQLTEIGNNYAPAWSPDDKYIVFASDRDEAEVSVGGVSVKTTDLYQTTLASRETVSMYKFPVHAGWLGVSNVRFQPGGRYFTFTALRYSQDATGKFTVKPTVEVHDFLGVKDFFDYVNCNGSSPAWASDPFIMCIQQPDQPIMTAEALTQTEPAGALLRSTFAPTKKSEEAPLILLDPRRFSVTSIAWSEK
jgi:Tol biopolymer transport system component/outer membrane protein assembly factor BamB